MRRRRILLLAAVAAAVAPALAIYAASLFVQLPAALAGDTRTVSVDIYDRGGKLVRRVRTAKGELSSPVRLAELAPGVVPALLAAEDSRFFSHPGIDVLAMARALGQAILAGRVVSGGSTITQQLARTVEHRPRTVRGKLREMVLALRIERALSKERILEEYLSRVSFGPNIHGIDAASRFFFDKPPSALDLSEAAALAGMPRGPVLYDPRRGTARLTRRRDRVLSRMVVQGLVDEGAAARARSVELRLSPQIAEGGMEHLVLGLVHGQVPSGLPAVTDFVRLDTTIDAALEREVTTLARRAAGEVRARGATALSVVVLDNESGDVLAYVGSQDYFGAHAGGANDGVLAKRQPGSTLKPFVYAAAMEELGMTAATLLPDVEVRLQTKEGPFVPRNYDGRMHGPVRLREALASSLNVPAVVVAEQVGPPEILERLRRAGFDSLDRSAGHYGAAIALGDGEVRLFELAQAYAMLARGGELRRVSFVQSAVAASGERVLPERRSPERVLDTRTAAVLTDVLSDDAARASSFGRDGALAFGFPVAAKTGTSKGYRDNWTVGYTREVTVAVWVGNFDGTPMTGSSGVTGAAPLFHDVMLAAMRGRDAAPLTPLAEQEALVRVEVCALSGARPGPHCAHRTRELFRPEQVPTETCAMHVQVRTDPENGLRAGPACGNTEERTFEAYPPRYLSWAKHAGRPLAPEGASPRCPAGVGVDSTSRVVSVRFPGDGARFILDPDGHSDQEIVLAARAGAATRTLRFVMDGRSLGSVTAPFELPWRLAPGRHRLALETDDGAPAPTVMFEVARAE